MEPVPFHELEECCAEHRMPTIEEIPKCGRRTFGLDNAQTACRGRKIACGGAPRAVRTSRRHAASRRLARRHGVSYARSFHRSRPHARSPGNRLVPARERAVLRARRPARGPTDRAQSLLRRQDPRDAPEPRALVPAQPGLRRRADDHERDLHRRGRILPAARRAATRCGAARGVRRRNRGADRRVLRGGPSARNARNAEPPSRRAGDGRRR